MKKKYLALLTALMLTAGISTGVQAAVYAVYLRDAAFKGIAARTGVCRVYRERIQPDGDFEQRGRGNVAIHFEHGQALRHGAGLVDG